MDGVIMYKFVKFLWSCVLIVALFGIGILMADKYALQNNLVRLHVVGASNSHEDQQVKLQVRDQVLAYLKPHLQAVTDAEETKQQLQRLIPELTAVAQQTLQAAGKDTQVQVYLTREEFDLRRYDTFSLPAGVYDALRVDIGAAEGKNWWCVVFPSLCAPVTTDAFCDEAVEAGYDQGLAAALSNDEGYEIRFFLLDCIGKIENFLHFS